MQVYTVLSPVTLIHIGLSLTKNKWIPVSDPNERMGVVIPVFNEGAAIHDTMESILKQTVKADELIIAENGSTDQTRHHINTHLKIRDYSQKNMFGENPLVTENYVNGTKPPITVAQSNIRLSKGHGINQLKEQGHLDHLDRILMADSDTILDKHFIENMKKHSYVLRMKKDKATLYRNTVIGAVVLTRPHAEDSFLEDVIRRSKEAEYTFGQLMVRVGQNHTALYVAPGCGFVSDNDHCVFPVRTVTEDLELTHGVQANREVYLVENRERFFEDYGHLHVHMPYGITNLESLLKNKEKIEYVNGNAHFVSDAVMFTEEPKTIPALMNQIDRWNAGFHQGLYLRGKEFRRKNPRIAFTLYGAKYEGMAAAGFLAAMPTLTASYMLTGYGLPPIALGIFAASDLAIQGSLLGVANYKKHRILGKNKKDAFKTGVKEAAQNILPLYGLRIANAYQFVKTYARTQWDGAVKKVRCWNSEWERPHKL